MYPACQQAWRPGHGNSLQVLTTQSCPGHLKTKTSLDQTFTLYYWYTSSQTQSVWWNAPTGPDRLNWTGLTYLTTFMNLNKSATQIQ